MSSTGSVNRASRPLSIEGERRRLERQDISSAPSTSDALRTTYGKIVKIDIDRALVKVNDLRGIPISNGRWIILSHSVREIAERWGQLKVGMIVLVQYRGQVGDNAVASIIKEEGEDIGEEKRIENEIAQGAYKIFAPGSLGI